MEDKWLERTELLIKNEGLEKLKTANVLIVGLGGVGSYAAEFICRAGVGNLTIIDGDVVDISNINRQLPALHSTIAQKKSEILATRFLDINPKINLRVLSTFQNPEDMAKILDSEKYDYVLDCIDSVTPKITLIKEAKRRKLKIISCMGAGGKTDPSKILVRDISKTNNCFLAKQIRKRLRKEHYIQKGVKCVFSTELQNPDSLKLTDGTHYKKSFYGTISYIPAAFGLFAAAEVVNFLVKKNN